MDSMLKTNGIEIYERIIYLVEPFTYNENIINSVSFRYSLRNPKEVVVDLYPDEKSKHYNIIRNIPYNSIKNDIKVLKMNKYKSMKHLEFIKNQLENYKKSYDDFGLALCIAISKEKS